jgi:hypothetical protein
MTDDAYFVIIDLLSDHHLPEDDNAWIDVAPNKLLWDLLEERSVDHMVNLWRSERFKNGFTMMATLPHGGLPENLRLVRNLLHKSKQDNEIVGYHVVCQGGIASSGKQEFKHLTGDVHLHLVTFSHNCHAQVDDLVSGQTHMPNRPPTMTIGSAHRSHDGTIWSVGRRKGRKLWLMVDAFRMIKKKYRHTPFSFKHPFRSSKSKE